MGVEVERDGIWTLGAAIEVLECLEKKELFLGYEAEDEEYDWWSGLAKVLLGELKKGDM